MAKKRPGVPTDPVGDPLARQCAIVVVPLGWVMPEGLICHYCSERPATTRDHIVPRALGGMDAWWNLVPACRPCNSNKEDRPPSCECAYCQRAARLFAAGHTRTRGRHPSLFSIKAKALPADLSHEAYLQRYDLPPSFRGST